MIDHTAPLYAALQKDEFERINRRGGGSIRTVLLALTPSMAHAEADVAKLSALHPERRAVVGKLDAGCVIAEHRFYRR